MNISYKPRRFWCVFSVVGVVGFSFAVLSCGVVVLTCRPRLRSGLRVLVRIRGIVVVRGSCCRVVCLWLGGLCVGRTSRLVRFCRVLVGGCLLAILGWVAIRRSCMGLSGVTWRRGDYRLDCLRTWTISSFVQLSDSGSTSLPRRICCNMASMHTRQRQPALNRSRSCSTSPKSR